MTFIETPQDLISFVMNHKKAIIAVSAFIFLLAWTYYEIKNAKEYPEDYEEF